MGTESENEAPQPPVNPKKKFLLDMAMELPYAKPIRGFFIREGKGFYDGLIVFAILAGLAGWFAWSKGYDHGAKDLESVKGELKDAKQDRDKYQIMLAPFQAMAIQVYTNVPIEKRFDYLTAQIGSIATNLQNAVESERPSFELYSDNTLITNGFVISLKKDRTVRLVVRNTSLITADQLQVWFFAPSGIATSNLIGGAYWTPQSVSVLDNSHSIVDYPFQNCWMWMADVPVPGNSLKGVNTFSITTNMTYPVIGDAYFKVSADRSKVQRFDVTLTFQ